MSSDQDDDVYADYYDDEDEYLEWYDDDPDDFFDEDDDIFPCCSDDLDFSSESDQESKNSPSCIIKGGGNEFLASMFAITQTDESFADVQVEFSDGKKLKTSRIILASMSDFFKGMLSSEMKEKLEGKIKLPTVSSKTFQNLLAFSLGQTVKLPAREDLIELLEMADMMQMKELVERCLHTLVDKLHPSNALETFLVGDKYQHSQTKETAKRYIFRSVDKITRVDDWSCLKQAELLSLVTPVSKSVTSSSWELGVLLRWVDATEADAESVVQVLDKTLQGLDAVPSILRLLLCHPCVVHNEEAVKLVRERLRLDSDVSLLAAGVAPFEEGHILRVWKEKAGRLIDLPVSTCSLPSDCALVLHHSVVCITGGQRESASKATLRFNFFDNTMEGGFPLCTARFKHGSAVVGDELYVAGGLPGPLASVEKCSWGAWDRWSEVGTLQDPVADCAAEAVGSTLLVVGRRQDNNPEVLVQTFHTKTGAAQVIHLDADLGELHLFRKFWSSYILTSVGCLLKLEEDKEEGTVHVESRVQLKQFRPEGSFVACFDGRSVVVCEDQPSTACVLTRYSFDGEREMKSACEKLNPCGKIMSITRGYWADSEW